MKILHLFSNWKWTGPAELAVNLCRRLADTHEVRFIPGSPPADNIPNEVVDHARERGLESLPGFRLKKHLSVRHNMHDVPQLHRLLRAERFDLIHAHMPNDHLVAGLAAMGMKRKPPIVRSFYGPDGPEPMLRTGLLLRRFTAGAIVISRRARANLIQKYSFPEPRSAWISVGVDTDRFDPDRFDRAAARETLGLAPDDFVFGIVARMQRHRRFEVLLEAMRLAIADAPHIRLVIVGRGTHREEVAIRPVQEMGLADKILFPGYLRGEPFVSALAAMDAGIFLTPGSDGSCRAVREKMAMGLPMIAAKVPPLDEMVEHGKTGFLVERTVEGIRKAVLDMVRDRDAFARMRKSALAFGQTHFSLARQARTVEKFYAHCLRKQKEAKEGTASAETFDPDGAGTDM
jgi:glycosyltransferase involved in cell wall biosynthesis